jgi:hypothetical protein
MVAAAQAGSMWRRGIAIFCNLQPGGTMKKHLSAVLGLLLAPALAIGMATPAPAANNTGAAIGGFIAGAAIGAAVASGARLPNTVYVPRPPPPPPPGPNPWSNAFKPDPKVTCYPVQRACYRNDGAFAPAWTQRVFNR